MCVPFNEDFYGTQLMLNTTETKEQWFRKHLSVIIFYLITKGHRLKD